MTYAGADLDRDSSGAGKWIAGFFLVIVLAGAFGALSLYLVTTESPAEEAHRRVVNALAEGDAILVRDYEQWRVTAEASEPGEEIALPNWPVRITLSREEIIDSTQESLHALLLARSADALYEEGTSVLRDDDAAGDPGRFTAAGIVDAFMDLLRGDVHTAALVTMIVLLAIALAIAASLALMTRGFGTMGAISACVTLGALLVLAGGAALYAYMRASSGEDTEYLRAELVAVGEELALVPLGVGAAFAVAGIALLAVSAVSARVSRDRQPGALLA